MRSRKWALPALLAASAWGFSASDALAQHRRFWPAQPYCPPQYEQLAPIVTPNGEPSPVPDPNQPLDPQSPEAIAADAFAQAESSITGSADTAAPAFIGDFFGGAGGTSRVVVDRVQFSLPRSNLNPTTFDTTFFLVEDGPFFVEVANPGITAINAGQIVSVTGPSISNLGPEAQILFQLNNPGVQGTVRDRGATVTVQNTSLITAGPDPLPNSNLAGGFDALFDYTIDINVPNPGGAGVVGRQKQVENSSPIPRSRVFFNYSYYNNVQFTPYSVGVNRYVFGAEKAIGNDIASLEFRLPFASTLDADIVADSMTAGRDTEFGNIPIFAKLRLWQGESYVIGGGLGVSIPTADDVSVRLANGQNLVNVNNQSVHLLPFVGGVYAPNENFYSQCMLQIDVDANGNPVDVTDFNGGRIQGGRLHDSTWMFLSFNAGYWVYRGDETQRISGVSPVVELHYNKTLNVSDNVSVGGFRIGDNSTNFEMINLVAGLNVEMFRTSYLNVAYVCPLTQGNDRAFDGELRVTFNRYFW